MKQDFFSPDARWIWSSRATQRHNNFVCFRRMVDVGGPLKSGELHITADARYEVWINGNWVGHGPARSWVEPWSVDTYDLSSYLVPGKNVIAVLVQDIGVGTFQYTRCEPGLLARVDWQDGFGRHTVETDATWKSLPHDGYAARVPRISVQQAWEEQFDAGNAPSGISLIWRTIAYDDSSWPAATIGRAVGQAPHANLEARDIPHLTREPIEAMRVVSTDIVETARYSISVDLRKIYNPHDDTANMYREPIMLATFIRSRTEQPIEVHHPHDVIATKLNGKVLAFDDHARQQTGGGVARAKLKAGWNVLMMRLNVPMHHITAVFNLWTREPVTFASSKQETWGEPWLAIGPFPHLVRSPATEMPPFVKPMFAPGATEAEGNRIWETGHLTEEDLKRPYCTPVSTDMVAPVDVYAICASERALPGATAKVDDVDALRSDTPEWTTIYPTKAGDTRVLLDFGNTVVGYHEFEIDAPAGAMLDVHNFEFVQRNGRINLAEGMNNSFRYSTREGVQRYRTFVRRGFRYSYLSFRNFDRPIRVRLMRVLQSTYPQSRQGSFACSDPKLTQIWEIGAHTVRSCSEDSYTDCPSYEQVHWVGDARNEALVDLVVNGDARLSRHCWIQAGRSLDRSPIVESHVPSAWQSVLPAWTFLWMRWAQEHYLLTGDKAFAKQAMTFLDRNYEGIIKALNDDGLFAMTAWNLFDWAPIDQPNDGVVTHVNCLCVLGLNQSAQLAHMLGKIKTGERWMKTAAGIARAVNAKLWDSRKRAYVDSIHADGSHSKVFSQQTHTAAYISGVATGARRQRSREIMQASPAGFVKAGSPFFMFFALEGLVREARFAEMIDTIRSYWWPQIEAGATTFWEVYAEGAARLTRSHCHGWSAAPTYFLSTHVLGIHPLSPGFATVAITPQPGDLRWAQGCVPTPRGPVSVYWRREGSSFEIDASVPGSAGTILILPATGRVSVLSGDVKKLSAKRGSTTFKMLGTEARLRILSK